MCALWRFTRCTCTACRQELFDAVAHLPDHRHRPRDEQIRQAKVGPRQGPRSRRERFGLNARRASSPRLASLPATPRGWRRHACLAPLPRPPSPLNSHPPTITPRPLPRPFRPPSPPDPPSARQVRRVPTPRPMEGRGQASWGVVSRARTAGSSASRALPPHSLSLLCLPLPPCAAFSLAYVPTTECPLVPPPPPAPSGCCTSRLRRRATRWLARRKRRPRTSAWRRSGSARRTRASASGRLPEKGRHTVSCEQRRAEETRRGSASGGGVRVEAAEARERRSANGGGEHGASGGGSGTSNASGGARVLPAMEGG